MTSLSPVRAYALAGALALMTTTSALAAEPTYNGGVVNCPDGSYRTTLQTAVTTPSAATMAAMCASSQNRVTRGDLSVRTPATAPQTIVSETARRTQLDRDMQDVIALTAAVHASPPPLSAEDRAKIADGEALAGHRGDLARIGAALRLHETNIAAEVLGKWLAYILIAVGVWFLFLRGTKPA